MKALLSALVAATLIVCSMPAIAESEVKGLWLNPRGTVAVRTGDCDGKLCGWIVWANSEAKADAKSSGIDQLIGIELLEDYTPDGAGKWSGSVYVPDMGHHFSSTIRQLSPSELKVQGCLIGGFICKSQIWQRVETLPHE